MNTRCVLKALTLFIAGLAFSMPASASLVVSGEIECSPATSHGFNCAGLQRDSGLAPPLLIGGLPFLMRFGVVSALPMTLTIGAFTYVDHVAISISRQPSHERFGGCAGQMQDVVQFSSSDEHSIFFSLASCQTPLLSSETLDDLLSSPNLGSFHVFCFGAGICSQSPTSTMGFNGWGADVVRAGMSNVPEPDTLVLVALALVGLSLSGRRGPRRLTEISRSRVRR